MQTVESCEQPTTVTPGQLVCQAVLEAGDPRHTATAALSITLDETDRRRRRRRLVSDQGLPFLLSLPSLRLLRHGDALLLSDGRQVLVQAEPEALYIVEARDPQQLLMLAWQLGNRHLPAEIRPQQLRIRRDHVIGDMLLQLGATVTDIQAPFNPQGGAYDRAQHG